jgi:hypothetical protein
MQTMNKGVRHASFRCVYYSCDIPFCLCHGGPAPVKVEVLQTKLDHPWSLAFLPGDQGMLITMRGGQLRQWLPGKAFLTR